MSLTVTARSQADSGTSAVGAETSASFTPAANAVVLAFGAAELDSGGSASTVHDAAPVSDSIASAWALLGEFSGTAAPEWSSGSGNYRLNSACALALTGASPVARTVTYDPVNASDFLTAYTALAVVEIADSSGGWVRVKQVASASLAGAGGGNSESLAVTFDASPVSGNLVVVGFASGADSGGGFASPTIGGQSMTEVYNLNNAYTQNGVWHRTVDGTEATDTITCSDLGQSVGNGTVFALEIEVGNLEPTDIPSLRADWDASRTDLIVHSGGDLEEIDDASGNGRLLDNVVGTPRTGDTTVNGLNVIDLDGSSGIWDAPFIAGLSDKTVFAVMVADTSSDGYILAEGAHTSANQLYGFRYDFSDDSFDMLARGNAGGAVSPSAWDSGAAPTNDGTTPDIITFTADDDGTVGVRVNGVAGSSSANAAVSSGTMTRLSIGYLMRDTNASFWSGSFCQIVVLEGVRSLFEIEAIEAALTDKWVSAGGGTSHALTASGSTTSAGAAAIIAARPLTASGSASASGAASLVAARPLTADGATTTDGAAALGRTSPLAAGGTASSAGTAALTAARPLTADGAATTAGGAAITAARPLSASGAATTSGSATIAIPGEGAVEHFLTASGSAVFGASGPLRVTHALVASGASVSTGAAALTASRPLAASGVVTSDGAAALVASRPMSAAGATTATGSATLALGVAPLPLSASGTVTAVGSATLRAAHTLAANGTTSADGSAVLTRTAALGGSGSGSLTGTAALGLTATLSAAGSVTTGGTARIYTAAWHVIRVTARSVGRIITRRRPSWDIAPTGPSFTIEPRKGPFS